MATVERKPVQVYLDHTYQAKLALRCERLGVSQAEVLRQGLDALARELVPPERDPAVQLIGLMGNDSDSSGDLSIEHDHYVVAESSKDQS